jgi:hypothetical protein
MSASPLSGTVDPASVVMGMHRLLPYAFDGIDVTPVWNGLIQRFSDDNSDAAALLDLSTILQSQGRTDDALGVLHQALQIRRTFSIVHGDGTGLRVLAFVTPGDFMANTPLDFLFEGSNCILHLHYVDAGTTALTDLPEHDIAFMAIGESRENGPVLERMADVLANWPGPIFNNKPLLIQSLTRDGVNALLDGEPALLSPKTLRLQRAQLEAVADGLAGLDTVCEGTSFPVIIRPIGTHAGHGLLKIETALDLLDYLTASTADSFYVAPFIDYRGADGLFNKQRIVLIKGRPFPSHMAISSHWMVHYMNAGMAESAEKRAVEAQWMADFDEAFAVRHRAGFEALYRRIGLDYFGIDCAELPDGRLLVFELDVAMIVHALDNAELYPYKKPAMHKLFDGFVASLEATCTAFRQSAAA